MPAPSIPKHKALKLIDRAQVHLAKGEFAEAEALLREVSASGLNLPQAPGFLGDALSGQGREDEAVALWQEALARDPKDPELNARLGAALSRKGSYAEALPFLERAQADKRKDSGTLIHLAFANAEQGRLEEAERAVGKALKAGGGAEAKLVLAVIRGRQGRYADAERLCSEVEASSSTMEVLDSAKAMRADARLLQGDAATALALWKDVRGRGRLDPSHLGHMAYAAQLCGDTALTDSLMAERTQAGPSAEDLLLFAQISNLRSRGEDALEKLDASERAEGARHPGHSFEIAATRGRALRLLGRRDEARAVLSALAEAPEASNARLGPKVQIDLGHLSAEEGDFETAERHFRAALKLDEDDPEAKRAMELTARRVAWRHELEASTEAQVEAAKAEAEAMRRRFSAREGELESLRQELEALRRAQMEALEKAKRAEEEARVAAQRAAEQARSEQQKKVREELAQREVEIEEKAQANLDEALGEVRARCPKTVLDGFVVAEKTFQKALYTDLPAAAVAVLYTGALERALYTFFVERFRVWLKEKGRLADFLKGAVRERRGTRVEYFDHFVEAFDEERPGRAPSMGEVGRVLERRSEPYLRPFAQFLEENWNVEPAFFDALATFVLWSKTELRDPVAHGRGDSVGYDQLKKVREGVLFSLAGREHGALAALVRAAK